MNAEVDYSVVLEDLKKRKAALEKAIEGINQIMGYVQTEDNTSAVPHVPSKTQSKEFSGMSTPGAIKKYLETTQKSQSTKEITEALKSGGFSSNAKSLSNNVYAVLKRMEKEKRGIVSIGKEWGLADWSTKESKDGN